MTEDVSGFVRETFYEMLRAAILEQAIFDYKKALKKQNEGCIKALERWFLSPYGEFLSDDRGAFIIENCRKCVDMKPKSRNVNL